MKVLVLDDDPIWAKTMKMVLPAYGLEVEAMGDLDAPAPEGCDAILLDLSMPGATAPEELTRQMCERFPGMPIVILTGRDDPGDDAVVSVILSGAQDWLSKEATAPAIVRAIRLAVARMKIVQLRGMNP